MSQLQLRSWILWLLLLAFVAGCTSPTAPQKTSKVIWHPKNIRTGK